MADTDQQQTTDAASADGQQAGTPEKIITQADLDREVETRLNRERRKFADYDTLKDKAKKFDDAQAAQQSETERLTNERDAATTAAQAATDRATARLITADAKVAAAALGIKPERIAAAIKLADLSEVKLGNDGEPDAAAIKTALEAVLRDLPELKITGGPVASAANPARGTATPADPKHLPQLSSFQWKT